MGKTTRILLCGALGKMGRAVTELALEREGCQVVAGIDTAGGTAPFPLFRSPDECDVAADVAIDFSHPSLLEGLLRYVERTGLPLVECTTGLSPEQARLVRDAGRAVPVFFSANMSIGVNLMAALCEKAAMALGETFDIEVIEKHHNQKLDAPSGTALMLADRMSAVLCEKPQYVYDRHSERRARRKEEIGLHAVRGGTIVGEHEVLFAGTDEVLTIAHRATSKRVFAAGALSAAVFLQGAAAGCYDMKDLV